jgi:hypothetical protein
MGALGADADRCRPREVDVDVDRACGAGAGRVVIGRQFKGVEEEGAYEFVIEGVSSAVLVVERGRCERSSLAGKDAGETGHGRRVPDRPKTALAPEAISRRPVDRARTRGDFFAANAIVKLSDVPTKAVVGRCVSRLLPLSQWESRTLAIPHNKTSHRSRERQ